MGVKLIMTTTDGHQRCFAVNPGRTVIGREPRCDLHVPLPTVSSRHCEILLADGRVEVKDLDSCSGTFRNGDRITQAVLGHADHVTVGTVTFEVDLDGLEASEGLSG